jgi:hypothetical protein
MLGLKAPECEVASNRASVERGRSFLKLLTSSRNRSEEEGKSYSGITKSEENEAGSESE